MKKTYKVIVSRSGRKCEMVGNIVELTDKFSYTLLCGHSRDRKINQHPSTIVGLVNALNRSAGMIGDYDVFYHFAEV